MKHALKRIFPVLLISACATSTPDIASISAQGDRVEATSLLGEPLRSPAPSAAAVAAYEAAKSAYLAEPDDADKLIWYGRRAAYLGNYQDAITIFSEGMRRHPQDARMLRHRGHRYISTRQFDKAVGDFEKAYALIQGTDDTIEPDGLPNALNIPLTSLHGNIRYHLGLAYYLQQDWESARRIFAEDLGYADNDDGIVASSHWLYMILRRMGRDADAARVLERISENMTIIENTAYHEACLIYKGLRSADESLPADVANPGLAGLVYGIANWYLYNGDEQRAYEIMNRLVDGTGWASFGYIAAEADLAAAQARK
jgi:hypothetical protein